MQKYRNKETGFIVEAEDYGTKTSHMLVQYDERLGSDAENYQNCGLISFLINKESFKNLYEEVIMLD